MDLRTSPVDLIEKENRQRRRQTQQFRGVDARPAILAKVGVIKYVARHHVDRAFDTGEGAAERPRRRTQKRRLPDSDIAFDQHMAAREDADRHQPDDARLPENGLLDFALEFKGALSPIGERLDDVQRVIQGLKKPQDAIVLANGDLLIAETGRHRIVRVPAGTDTLETFIGGLLAPAGLTCERNGAIFVTDTAAGTLLRVELATRVAHTIVAGLIRPEGIALAANGTLYLAEVGARRLWSLEADGHARSVGVTAWALGGDGRSSSGSGGSAGGNPRSTATSEFTSGVEFGFGGR